MMRITLRSAAVVLAVVVPTVAETQEPGSPLTPPPVQPAPPPLVPERQLPRLPVVPLPPGASLRLPVPPAARPPSTSCGMRVMQVDPAIDPKFAQPVPEAGPRFLIRELPVPCTPTTTVPPTAVVPVPQRAPVPPVAPVPPAQ